MNTRDRLVAATRELMWEKGYAATSPKDIQRAAGAGQGSMYHHFSGKEDLAVTAMEQTAASVVTISSNCSPDRGPLLSAWSDI